MFGLRSPEGEKSTTRNPRSSGDVRYRKLRVTVTSTAWASAGAVTVPNVTGFDVQGSGMHLAVGPCGRFRTRRMAPADWGCASRVLPTDPGPTLVWRAPAAAAPVRISAISVNSATERRIRVSFRWGTVLSDAGRRADDPPARREPPHEPARSGAVRAGEHGLRGRRHARPVLPHGVVAQLAELRRDLPRRPGVGHLELLGGLVGVLVATGIGVRPGARVGDADLEQPVAELRGLPRGDNDPHVREQQSQRADQLDQLAVGDLHSRLVPRRAGPRPRHADR